MRNVKKVVTPAAKRKAAGGFRKAAGGLRKTRPASERRICRLLSIHRWTARSRPEVRRHDGVRPQADSSGCEGWPGGAPANAAPHASSARAWWRPASASAASCSRLGLQVRTKRRRRLWRPRVRMPLPTRPNERWSIDFMSDQLASGRRFRIPERRRRLLQDVRRPAGGHLDHRGQTGALPGRAGQGRGASQGRRLRQRPRAHQQGDALLERTVRRGA